MANKYEQAVARLGNQKVIEELLKKNEEEKRNRDLVERAYLGPEYDNISPEDKSRMMSVLAQDSNVGIPILRRNLENINREIESAKDLEAIIDYAPKNALIGSMQFVPSTSEDEIGDYHNCFYLGYQMADAQKGAEERKKDAKKISELEQEVRSFAMRKFVEEYKDKDASTREFIEFYASLVINSNSQSSSEFSLFKFQKYLSEAQKYLTDDKNQKAIREYLKREIDEKYKSELYKYLVLLDG